jgi:hypothetical protein
MLSMNQRGRLGYDRGLISMLIHKSVANAPIDLESARASAILGNENFGLNPELHGGVGDSRPVVSSRSKATPALGMFRILRFCERAPCLERTPRAGKAPA